MASVRILVADDHEVVRRGVCALVESHAGWEVCCEVGDGRQAVAKTAELRPDIVILDVGMPRLNGLEAARQILRADPRQRILVLTMSNAEQVVQEALKAGARGFLSKSDAAEEVIFAVDALVHDRTYFNSRVGEMVLTRFLHGGRPAEGDYGLPALTPREREVLQLLAEGQTTKEVAATLSISVKTAETHRSNLMRKLGLHNVSELVMYAVRNNIVSVGEQLAAA